MTNKLSPFEQKHITIVLNYYKEKIEESLALVAKGESPELYVTGWHVDDIRKALSKENDECESNVVVFNRLIPTLYNNENHSEPWTEKQVIDVNRELSTLYTE